MPGVDISFGILKASTIAVENSTSPICLIAAFDISGEILIIVYAESIAVADIGDIMIV